jgi:hypothetical protein
MIQRLEHAPSRPRLRQREDAAITARLPVAAAGLHAPPPVTMLISHTTPLADISVPATGNQRVTLYLMKVECALDFSYLE